MTWRKFQKGDKVTVTAYSAATYAPGVEDTLGTEDLFRSIVGKVYTVRGYDKGGYVELWPTRRNTIWINPKFLKLRARKKTKLKPQVNH